MEPNASPFPIPAILSRGKGKAKFSLDEDGVPLTHLKKFKYGQPVSDTYFSELESAALSLTELHEDTRFNGPVQTFLHAPLLLSHGQHVNKMPQPGCLFAFDETSSGLNERPHSSPAELMETS